MDRRFIVESWPERLERWRWRLMEHTLCRVRGHNSKHRKMAGYVCSRCYTFTHR